MTVRGAFIIQNVGWSVCAMKVFWKKEGNHKCYCQIRPACKRLYLQLKISKLLPFLYKKGKGTSEFQKISKLLNILNLMPILACHLYMSIIAEGPRTSHKTQECRKRKG